ncbi:hypothetical protein SVIOM342S_10261 [Streptomyces violaceorubidus]
MESTPSSALSFSAEVRSGSPAGAVFRPPDRRAVAASAPGAAVQLGQVQLQVTAVGAERVQRQPTWASRPASGLLGRARSQKSSREALGLSPGDPFPLGPADAVHVREGEAQTPGFRLARRT